MEVLCPQCWKSFRVNGKGRRAKYCSVSCKKKAYRRGEHNAGCDLCNLRTLLRLMMNQIEAIPAWFPLIDDALGVAFNALEEAHGYASHEHDRGEVECLLTPTGSVI